MTLYWFLFTCCVLELRPGASEELPMVHHAKLPLPKDWRALNEMVPDEHLITLLISIRKTNLDDLRVTAQQVSDPRNPQYGHYLTATQLRDFTRPSAEHVNVVKAWLADAGAHAVSCQGNGLFEAKFNTISASRALQTQFYQLLNDKTGQYAVLADDYWLPESVDAAISAIYGLHGLPLPPRRRIPTNTTPANVTPEVLQKTYKIDGVSASGSAKNRQAVAEFSGETFSAHDLRQFFEQYVAGAPSSASKVSRFVGVGDVGPPGDESMLDIEYIMGVSPGLLTEFWYWKGISFCGNIKNWTSTILANDDAPLVHSLSYGWQGDLKEFGCKDVEVQDIEADFVMLAARGISLIVASGDSGSGYDPDQLPPLRLFPSWPASSPWVTAVGATRFSNQQVGQPEVATDMFGSGGGFSWMYGAFEDQADAIRRYLATAPKLPPHGSFPTGGRATPDVSTLGEGFQVILNGTVTSNGGTSASTPSFAAMVSLLNEARLHAGRPPMGYLNPWLYQNPDAFTDVTKGSNAIGRGPFPTPYGFNCTKGWDPVTGLGTPRFDKMLAAANVTGMTAVADAVVV